jgi:hypothetical protein
LKADVRKDADRSWSTVDVKCEKRMIRIGGGGQYNIISEKSIAGASGSLVSLRGNLQKRLMAGSLSSRAYDRHVVADGDIIGRDG